MNQTKITLLSLFFNSLNLDDCSAISQKIKATLGISFLQETILPIDKMAPPEFPRIILANTAPHVVIEVFPNRVNLQFKQDDGLVQKMVAFCKDAGVLITRIGIVQQISIEEMKESAIDLIREKFLNKNNFSDETQDLQLNFMKRLKILDKDCNFWTRHYVIRKSNNLEDNKTYAIECDLNTIAENVSNFEYTTINSFLNQMFKTIDETIAPHVQHLN